MTESAGNGSVGMSYFNNDSVSQKSEFSPGMSCSLEYPECSVARYLWIIASPILLFLGTFGNIMVFIIMRTKVLRTTAFGCYLAAIAITDTIGIWVALSRHFTKNLFLYDIRNFHSSICSLQRFLLYGSINTSVWLLVAVCLERTLSIYAPTKAQVFKSLGRTKIIICLIALIQYGWNSQVFFTRGAEYKMVNGTMLVTKQCGYRSDGSFFYWHYVHTYIAMIDYSIIPFIAMLVMNIAIILKLKERDREYEECAALNKKSMKGGKSKLRKSTVSHKTRMLLPVTFFFLATTLPSLAFTGAEEAIETVGRARAQMELVDFVSTILLYLNHSMSFVLYCVSGAMFRRVCWSLLNRCRGRSDTDRSDWYTQFERSPNIVRKAASSAETSSVVPKSPMPLHKNSKFLTVNQPSECSSGSVTSYHSKNLLSLTD